MLNYWALHGRLTSAERTNNTNQRPARLALGVARGSLADARTAADVVNQLGAARRARDERRAAPRIDRLSELRGFGPGKVEMFRQINVHSIQDLEAVQESPLIARLVSKKRDRCDQLKALQHYKAMAQH